MDASVFFYVDGIPTKGCWIDLDETSDMDDVRGALVAGGFMTEGYGGDILAADAEGLARPFLGRYGTFDMRGFVEAAELVGGGADEDAVLAYIDAFGSGVDLGKFRERYRGEFDTVADMAEEFLGETGGLQEIPLRLQNYFDFEKYGRDLLLGGDFCESGGHYFWAH